MSDIELRLECLKLAREISSEHPKAEDLIAKAEKLLNYIKGSTA